MRSRVVAAAAVLLTGAMLVAQNPPVLGLPVLGPPVVALRGAKVTFERVLAADEAPQVQSLRARLLSLSVERGETPSPLLSTGLFRATFRAMVTLPVRDRYRFRVDGRGSAKLSVNGEMVLDGVLRPGKPLVTAAAARLKKGENELQLVFESSAMGDGQVRLFWAAPDAAFEPIAPEAMTWPADDKEIIAGEQLRHGQQLFGERRCARCHEPEHKRIGESAFGELDTSGPDLRNVGRRAQRDWLAAWLRDPRAMRADAAMPRIHFEKPQDADDLAAWLAGLGTALAEEPFAADAAAKGAVRFLQLGCIACHVGPERDRKEAAVGDRLPLDYVPQKWHAPALVNFLCNPRADYPHVRMPDFALSRDDATILAAYLLASKPLPLAPSRGDGERGRKLAQKHGCAQCHELALPIEERRSNRLRNLKPERGCLADKVAGDAPDHSLAVAERAALRAFLPFAEDAPFRRAPLDYASRNVRAQRCTSCHGLDGNPSVWALLAEQASVTAPLPQDQDPRVHGIPSLTWVGAKLQPSWIARFVTGKEKSPRPWLTMRMPAFHVCGEAITAGLVREHGYGPQDEPQVAADAQGAIHGERLVQTGVGFNCVQCHAIGDKPAVGVFDRAGIDLLLARGRLRHEYYSRWLLDPPRIDPDARMTKFADATGRTGITDVLSGDAVQQFEAIWQYLGAAAGRR